MMRVVDLKTEPVIGKMYLVPCIPLNLRALLGQRFEWIPVMGSLHEDKDIIGFLYMHWHYDFRFVSERIFRKSGGAPPISEIDLKGVVVGYAQSVVVERRMKCLRRMPRYPVQANFRKALEAAYVSARVIEKDGCRLCPHKGIPLHGLPTEKDGSVVCPGHGLRWAKNGKLIPRTS